MRYTYLGNLAKAGSRSPSEGSQAKNAPRRVVLVLGLIGALQVGGVATAVQVGGRREEPIEAAESAPEPPAVTVEVPAEPPPPPPPPGPPIVIGPSPLARLVQANTPDGRPTVALTLDDGPDPRWTPVVLQILREEGVVATFCTVETMTAVHPELVRAEADQGHAACDHTVHHDDHLDRRPVPDIAAEVNGQADRLRSILGAEPPYFRAPGGNLSPPMIDLAHQRGMRVLQWSADVADFRPHSPLAMTARMLAFVRPGTIMLLHDGGGDRSATVAMLRPLIQQLKARGYVFVLP